MIKKALIMGAGGFIGSHMVSRLNQEGYMTLGVDIKNPEFSDSDAHEFYLLDLTEKTNIDKILVEHENITEIYQYAADMGGAGFIFTGDNDADIMHNSSLINLNLLRSLIENYSKKLPKVFYSSSACIYPEEIQESPDNPGLKESDAYPAN